jgi:hypothetical protein
LFWMSKIPYAADLLQCFHKRNLGAIIEHHHTSFFEITEIKMVIKLQE